MPEGPEVAALARAVTQAGIGAGAARAHGKHLFVNKQDWSFGLSGQVRAIRPDDASLYDGGEESEALRDKGDGVPTLTRPVWTGGVCGKTVAAASVEDMIATAKLGVDWMTASKQALEDATKTWNYSRRQLGALLTDQHIIAGIGVAWGSEILARAGNLRPELPARHQSLRCLVAAMIAIRDEVWAVYAALVDAASDKCGFINDWFENLYAHRAMHVYYKGQAIKAGGRTWWVIPRAPSLPADVTASPKTT